MSDRRHALEAENAVRGDVAIATESFLVKLSEPLLVFLVGWGKHDIGQAANGSTERPESTKGLSINNADMSIY
ncbi:hypothetical protein OPT61_g10426 [Boeremia exigua]|uniref:Uncharacterized protein n=1 Tax=Boeremia exigua TaxID=749465 RepID=A0ACC2HR69_9PLEO|nr:hypothetical protein OPT61_g10426 [Boeremia exigua]